MMIYVGAALMVYNIWQYIRFARRIRAQGHWEQEGRILRVPIVLLILFLIGYLAVAVFGQPDLIVSSILLGGSVFVLVMDALTERIAALETRESEAERASPR
jgi:hypothetical protein